MSEAFQDDGELTGFELAVIGMAMRFPGATDPATFWRQLAAGSEATRELEREQLVDAGVPTELLRDPNYVRRVAYLDHVDLFDAAFFGISPREAEIMDPQHRFFLECAWEALESAGHDPKRAPVSIGVYGGAGVNSYAFFNLATNPELIELLGGQQARVGNRVDNLTTRVCYKLDLRGPGVTVQTTCSTSLVAVHMACQGVLAGDCDMALAGGVTITVPQERGYPYQEGGILSPDGHCRAFDARAAGFVPGNGAGVVVIKRLEDALADGDPVRAVIRGTAINNDGSEKVGYTAPSVEGQADAILAAQRMAGIDPETVSYVEAHGTGTPIGDPIEVSALKEVFEDLAPESCALGSVKSNIGHLDAAAGVAGLIKTVLALEKGQIPPSLHFETPNPALDLAHSPFWVPTELTEWSRENGPRRAGVSSFGIGGTNAHAVLEEAPGRPPSGPARPVQVLAWSARTETALDTMTQRLATHLRENPEVPLADVAWTLQIGRAAMGHRRALVCRTVAEATQVLAGETSGDLVSGVTEHDARPVVFLFPGQGAQYPAMSAGLYRSEPIYREQVDQALDLLEPPLASQLRSLICRPETDAGAAELLQRTEIAQPALFIVEHALATLWRQWGVEPAAMLGHSLGELVAASLAGVMPWQDMLALVVERGRQMQAMPEGAMLSVSLSEDEVLRRLPEELELSAVNGAERVVVGGPAAQLASWAADLESQGVETKPVPTSHAFHTRAMAEAEKALTQHLEGIDLQPPEIPFISSLTGDWIEPHEATDPAYWGRQLRRAVRFHQGCGAVGRRFEQAVLLEVGPGRSLSSLARRHPGLSLPVVNSLGGARDGGEDQEKLLSALARLWLAGAPVDWQGFAEGEERHRVVLPTYPFERRRHWVEPGRVTRVSTTPSQSEAETQTGASASDDETVSPAARESNRPSLPTAFEEPVGEMEKQLAEIWSELLGIWPIGRRDDFFELGGDSLLATRVATRLRGLLDREVALGLLLEATTLATLAPRLGEPAAEAPQGEAADDLRPTDRSRPLALSYAQQQLWFLDRLDPGNDAYNMPTALELRGDLDPGVLQRALEEIVRRHEALRTSFEEVDGQPVQRVRAAGPIPLPKLDLEGLGEEALRRELHRLARFEAARAFDLGRAPLLRAQLVRLEPTNHVLLLTLHHICCDGWSWGVLYAELDAIYRALAAGRPSPLPELEIQYGDYAHWQRRSLTPEALDGQIEFWRRRLDALPVYRPTAERPRPEVSDGRGERTVRHFDGAVMRAAGELARATGATLFMVLVASFAVVMHQRSQQRDLVLGTDFANRRRREVEGLIGFFVNQIVLRLGIEGNPTFGDLLDQARATVLEAFAHQDVPFGRLVSALQPSGGRFRSPFFQWKLVLQNNPLPAVADEGPRPEPLPLYGRMAKFDLLINLLSSEDGLRATAEYRSELYDPAFVATLLEDYETVLALVTESPERRLDELVAALTAAADRRAAEDRRALGKARKQSFSRLARRRSGAAKNVESDGLLLIDKETPQ